MNIAEHRRTLFRVDGVPNVAEHGARSTAGRCFACVERLILLVFGVLGSSACCCHPELFESVLFVYVVCVFFMAFIKHTVA